MANLKSPLFSLDAHNTLGKVITFVKRRGRNIAEKKPEIIDVKSAAQLSWRHMYLKCAALWHDLSTAEQQDWNSLGGIRHMTGFAYWQSQCLRPNPGIYLPLQGGTMSGDIDMAKNRILKLPAPTDGQEAFRLSDYATYVLPYLYRQGARVYHSVNQAVPNAANFDVAFNSEDYDTDTIHDNAVNNSRLTCKTAGKYIICASLFFDPNFVGFRMALFRINATTSIANMSMDMRLVDGWWTATPATIYHLDVGDFVECRVYQTSGAPLNLLASAKFSPYFMMQRIG